VATFSANLGLDVGSAGFVLALFALAVLEVTADAIGLSKAAGGFAEDGLLLLRGISMFSDLTDTLVAACVVILRFVFG
jgi:hypothetical protein